MGEQVHESGEAEAISRLEVISTVNQDPRNSWAE